jgi:dethiobiotin synthetase
MSKAYIVAGTDTGIGKTTVAAMLTLALDALYWKPIQSGTADGTDRQRVQAIARRSFSARAFCFDAAALATSGRRD